MKENCIHLEKTESTNNYLREICSAQNNVPQGTVVLTDYQTAGRGQRGNGWESEPGKNLLFSLLLHPVHIPVHRQFVISQIVSLAMVEVLQQFGNGFSVKWPNDIYYREKKIAGILIENDIMGTQLGNSIIGIGLNVNQKTFLSNAPNPVSLHQITGHIHNPVHLLQEILDRMAFRYNRYTPGEDEEIQQSYLDHLFRKEGWHPFEKDGKRFEARIKDIAATGHLILETKEGKEYSFAFKEVSFVL